MLRIEALGEPMFGLSMMVAGTLRGAGDTKGPFFIALLGMWVVRLPLAWVLLTFAGMGLEAIWLAMMLDMVSRGVASLVRFRRKTWLSAWDEGPSAAVA